MASSSPPSHNVSSTEVTAYQEVILAEDELLARLWNLLSVSTDPNIHNLVAQHISPWIQLQLSQWKKPETEATAPCTGSTVEPTPLLHASTPLKTPFAKHTSVSHPILLPDAVDQGTRDAGIIFACLPPQRRNGEKPAMAFDNLIACRCMFHVPFIRIERTSFIQ